MRAPDVLNVLARLDEAGVPVWVDGGWGVDALLACQTRSHGDLDLVVARADCARAEEALAPLGFRRAPDAEPGLPTRLVLRAPDGRQVDLHPVVFDGHGNGWQELPRGGWGVYPAEGLTGRGEVGGRTARCITPELQLRHHLGYEPSEADRRDMRLLAARFGVSLPPSWRENERP